MVYIVFYDLFNIVKYFDFSNFKYLHNYDDIFQIRYEFSEIITFQYYNKIVTQVLTYFTNHEMRSLLHFTELNTFLIIILQVQAKLYLLIKHVQNLSQALVYYNVAIRYNSVTINYVQHGAFLVLWGVQVLLTDKLNQRNIQEQPSKYNRQVWINNLS